jgi:hypothetical protein
MQAPVTGPFGLGVVQGLLGAAPTTGDGSVIATTSASAATLSPRLVAISEGMMARAKSRVAVQIPTAITKV